MLKLQIDDNLKKALKEGRELEVSVLRLLKTVIVNKEKEKRYKLSKGKSDEELEKMGKESQESQRLEEERALTDEEILDAVSSEIKKRKEAIELYDKGKRPELAEKERKEAEILHFYLPAQMPEEEIRKIVTAAVQETGAEGIKDMGRVMGQITPQVKGKADMFLVSKIVKESLI